jgi:membrane protein
MPTYAAALSYQLLLALFPFVIFLLALLGALGLPELFDQLLDQARLALPPDAYQLVVRVIGEIRGQPREGLLSVSILFSLWAASAGLRSISNALNVAYDVAETRSVWLRLPLSLIYTLGLAMVMIVATALLLLSPQASGWLVSRVRFGDNFLLWAWLRWPVVVALLLLTFAIIHKVAPIIDRPFRYVTSGSVVGVSTWIVASLGFSAYVDNFGNYGATYGSLGGMEVLLLYFFVSAAVLLFGAEINATIHPAVPPARAGRASAVETTVCEEPMRAT